MILLFLIQGVIIAIKVKWILCMLHNTKICASNFTLNSRHVKEMVLCKTENIFNAENDDLLFKYRANYIRITKNSSLPN